MELRKRGLLHTQAEKDIHLAMLDRKEEEEATLKRKVARAKTWDQILPDNEEIIHGEIFDPSGNYLLSVPQRAYTENWDSTKVYKWTISELNNWKGGDDEGY